MTTQTATYQPAAPPAGLAAVDNGAAPVGTFAAATYFWKVTFTSWYDGMTESVGSSEATVAIALNHCALLTLPAVPYGTKQVNVYRGTTTNTENKLVGTVTPVAGVFPTTFLDTGVVGATQSPPAASSLTTVTKKTGLPSVDKATAAIAALAPGFQGQAQAAINEWLQCGGGGVGTGTGTQALRNQKRMAALGLRLQEV
jgi:hypothetical protein